MPRSWNRFRAIGGGRNLHSYCSRMVNALESLAQNRGSDHVTEPEGKKMRTCLQYVQRALKLHYIIMTQWGILASGGAADSKRRHPSHDR